ncbi:glycoside hydrolase family 108 protein [Pararhodospirillum oryzae]|uniref:Uncharacterized protein n=1 Tax=Pararhodospirillum oryzae TaxID=478448 RepID=A0A512HA00_9PROT|nr:glycosyl hydrolase 108 family protein [Pararhodospirillum oryzae]GEO82287.1 hypothetical protein ROR02_24180 [Pararhodospirillum oryzae]
MQDDDTPIIPHDPVWAAALAAVLAHEGGYVDDPHDPGGATQWGISLRWLCLLDDDAGDIDGDGDVDADDVRALTPAQAGALYYKEWWAPLRCPQMPPPIAIKLFDTAINVGQRRAVRMLQQALNAQRVQPRLTEDGLLGPRTLAAVQAPMWVQSPTMTKALLAAMAEAQESYYQGLVDRKPARARYLRGWTRRARWLPELSYPPGGRAAP